MRHFSLEICKKTTAQSVANQNIFVNFAVVLVRGGSSKRFHEEIRLAEAFKILIYNVRYCSNQRPAV